MATRNPIYFGELEAVHIIGDTLQRPEIFVKNSDGSYQSFTDFTLSSILYDAFGVSVATPNIIVSTAIPPEGLTPVDDCRINIYANPETVPTKQGDYLLVITKVDSGDPTNISTVIRIKYKFEQPYFD